MLGAILIVHFIWAGWMIAGVALAVAGFHWPGLWRRRVFRIAHLAGLLATATVPIWGGGICPLTRWEGHLRAMAAGSGSASVSESFLARAISDLLYLDIDPVVLSVVTAAGALVTLLIFVLRPPWGAESPTRKSAARVTE